MPITQFSGPEHRPARIGVVAGMTIDAAVEMDFVLYLGD
jgi:hypothetical protein